MLERIGKILQGYLKIRITGYSPERFLNLCKNKGISIWELEARGNAYEMYITVKAFRKLKPVLKKTGTKITILEKYGTPFFFYRYRKRKVFFSGILIAVVLIFLLSRFIWKIEIIDNSTVTDNVLIEYLESENVFHGMPRSSVDCEMISKNIRKQFNDIIWVSVALDGTTLSVHVKENTDTFQVSNTEKTPSDIVASADGIVTEIVTRSGVPCVKAGDSVKVGDVLVSSLVEVKNDAGEVIREDLKESDADIWAEVMIPYEDICKTTYETKVYNKNRHKQIFLKIMDYQFGIGIRKNETECYEIYSEESQLQLGENFYLPVFWGINNGKGYELTSQKYTETDMRTILQNDLDLYCKKLEENNIKILQKNIQLQKTESGIKASGSIKTIQSIGTPRKTIDF